MAAALLPALGNMMMQGGQQNGQKNDAFVSGMTGAGQSLTALGQNQQAQSGPSILGALSSLGQNQPQSPDLTKPQQSPTKPGQQDPNVFGQMLMSMYKP